VVVAPEVLAEEVEPVAAAAAPEVEAQHPAVGEVAQLVQLGGVLGVVLVDRDAADADGALDLEGVLREDRRGDEQVRDQDRNEFLFHDRHPLADQELAAVRRRVRAVDRVVAVEARTGHERELMPDEAFGLPFGRIHAWFGRSRRSGDDPACGVLAQVRDLLVQELLCEERAACGS